MHTTQITTHNSLMVLEVVFGDSLGLGPAHLLELES
jgi:hypothetical protein